MMQTGWLLLLLLCTVLLFIGCTVFNARTPTTAPQPVPEITLTTASDLQLTESAPRTPSVALTLIPQTPAYIASRTPGHLTQNIVVETPTCYLTPGAGLLCLGIVRSRASVVTGDITLRLSLFDSMGDQIAGQTITLEQDRLYPGQLAPYRGQFRELSSVPAGISAELVSVSRVDPGLELVLENVRGGMLGTTAGYERYVFTAQILNPHEQPAIDGQIVLSVFDSSGALTGYRVLRLGEELAPGEQRALRLDVIPQLVAPDLYHYVSASARR